MADYAFEVLDQALNTVDKGLLGVVTLPQSIETSSIDIGGTFSALNGTINMTADPVGSGGGGGDSVIQRTIPALARVSP